MAIVVRFQRLDGADPQIALPQPATDHAAGADVRANMAVADRTSGITLAPGARALIPAGFAMELPVGFEAQIRPRSGLALKHGITLANSPGTIDADYRGPVGVIMINLGAEPFTVAHGDRIAQMVVAPVTRFKAVPADHLDQTDRGTGGFGSTGTG